MAATGQSATPIFVAGMEELARRPDTTDANCWRQADAPVGGLPHRRGDGISATDERQSIISV